MTDSTTKPDALLADCLFWIRTTDYVSFAELENWLASRGTDVKGDHCIEIGARNNVLWAGVSPQFCEIFDQLRPHLDLQPCSSLMVYMIDGKMLRMPIGKRPPRNGYREPHWIPVTLRSKQRATPAETRKALIQVARERES